MTRVVAVLLLSLVMAPACGRSEQTAETLPALEAAAAAPEPRELLVNGILLDGGLLVGGQPSLEQLAVMRDLGYRTIVSLRGPDEPAPSADELRSLGLEPVSLPIASAGDLNEEHARRLADILERADGPVVLHCASGNRVGALLALKAHWVDGASPREAVEIGLAAGLTKLEPTVREVLGVEEE